MGQVIEISRRAKQARSNQLRNVPPGRRKNAELRSREYLLPDEVAAMVAQAGKVGRHPIRDRTIILSMYRHGLRVSETINLRLDALNLKQSRMWVKRIKNSLSTQQPIAGDELRAIKRHLATRDDKLPWLFISERDQPFTRQAVNYIIAEAGKRARLGHVHPHMLQFHAG